MQHRHGQYGTRGTAPTAVVEPSCGRRLVMFAMLFGSFVSHHRRAVVLTHAARRLELVTEEDDMHESGIGGATLQCNG